MSKPLCIEPMKINKIPEGKEHMLPTLCESGTYFAEIKKDGYWYQFEKSDDKCYLWSRTVSKVTGTLAEKSKNVPHIINTLSELPNGTVIIGEIYYPGKESKDVTPIMGSLPEKAIERQKGEYGYLHYYIYDMIYFAGMSLIEVGAYNRYKLLEAVVKKYNLLRNQFIEFATIYEDHIQETIAKVLESGEEGMVLKKKTAHYAPGKRPIWDTIKIKKTDTCDAICIGSCEPTKYYAGKLNIGPNYTALDETGQIDWIMSNRRDNPAYDWPYWIIEEQGRTSNEDGAPWAILSERRVPIGEHVAVDDPDYQTMPVTKAYYYGWPSAIRIGAYNDKGEVVEIGTISSGLSDQMQEELKEQPFKYFNKVVELAGMEKNKEDHTLRHFYFKRLRDDKDPTECTLTSIFG